MNRGTRFYQDKRQTVRSYGKHVYVQCVDGNFYQDPILMGPGWYLQFYESGYPNLILFGVKTVAEVQKMADEVLEKLGIQAEIVGMDPPTQSRYFPPHFQTLRRAAIVHLNVQSPIPKPQIGPKVDWEKVSGVFYRWTSSQSESSSLMPSNVPSSDKCLPESKNSEC